MAVEFVFFLTLLVTFIAALLGRKHAQKNNTSLSSEHLNKWLIGLSAGATANSGFIVTGAVGLGYSQGLQWIFLPLAWCLGDLVFWKYFPHKINAAGKAASANTMSELLADGLSKKGKMSTAARTASIFTTLLILLCLGGYTCAQWIAGQKFVGGAFTISAEMSLVLFACVVIAYTSIGGFRGSVYADATQAVIRLIGTLVALIAVVWVAYSNWPSFSSNISNAGDGHLSWLPGSGIISALFFILGYAFASLGFGLGQPQILSRYIAGSSPQETQAAKWIYIGFVQFTWLTMTLFGVLLRGIMPELDDPEVGLSVFFTTYFGAIITGIIVADVFATIAATSNSLLVTMSQALIHDLGIKKWSGRSRSVWSMLITVVMGLATMLAALYFSGESSVFSLALGSISLMGAGLAAPVMIKVIGWQRSGESLLCSILAGIISALAWRYFGLESMLNEAAIGIVFGLIANWLVVKATHLLAAKPVLNARD